MRHPRACMISSDPKNPGRYCGWLLHGHPWCGTHGHRCEDLIDQETKPSN
jgi:hypothetical protein